METNTSIGRDLVLWSHWRFSLKYFIRRFSISGMRAPGGGEYAEFDRPGLTNDQARR
jgi:hypothetical protein